MQGVTTYVYNPNRRNSCTTALRDIPETRGMAPSHLSILASHAQLFRSFQRFPTTDVQSSSAAVKTRPRYLKEVTVARVLTYS